MKSYNPDASCPKCGHDKVGTEYVPERQKRSPGDWREPYHEHQERRCERCRYAWAEHCGRPRKKRRPKAIVEVRESQP